ncbi:ATP-binding protein [Magnetococcales bacterium HHB-1]
MKKTEHPFSVAKKSLLFTVLALLSVGGNYFNITLFFGVNFIFGSIATLIAVQRLGVIPGTLIAAIGGGFTFFLWGHPYAAIIFTIEGFVVGLLMRHLSPSLKQLALADILYWLFLGAPLVLFFYNQTMDMDLSQARLIALKQPVNGILNALLAAIILMIVDGLREKKLISIGTIIFNTLATALFITAIVLTAIYTRTIKENAEKALENELVFAATVAEKALELKKYHMIFKTANIRVTLSPAPKDNLIPVTKRLFAHLPSKKGPAMKRWKRATYIVQRPLSAPRFNNMTTASKKLTTIIVEKPAAAIINTLHQTAIQAFIILSLFVFIALLGSVLFSRQLIRPLQNLSRLTRKLPKQIKTGQPIAMLQSALIEPHQLARVFHGMAQQLALSFNEIHTAKEGLEKRVQERTEALSKAKEIAEAASQAKTEFISSVSHELRTPLTAILGSLKLIQGGVVGAIPKKVSSLIDTAIRNSERLLSLVNDVLDFSKIEAGKMIFSPKPEDASLIVHQATESVQNLIKDKNLTLTSDVPEKLMIMAEAKRVEQVLINLLGNAIKFTEQGRIAITLQSKDNRAVFSVSDTGCGISETQCDTIFDLFSQADASSTKKVGGTGLGLTISKRFIEMHGGEIWVESEEGRGATFTFTVPLSLPTVES